MNLVLTLPAARGHLQDLAAELHDEARRRSEGAATRPRLPRRRFGYERSHRASLDVGLMIYNAAYSPMGAFLDNDVEEHLKAVDVNVRGPLRLSHYFGHRFVDRGKGGIILMSSMSGFQGTAMVANYAATKAYDTILAEGLWYELRQRGVDVLACVAGATLTPSYESVTERIPTRGLARPMQPDDVTEQALSDLGQRPIGVSGGRNRFAAVLLSRLLSRRGAIEMVSKETERLYG